MDPVVHFELPCDDRNRIARFFKRAFGWKMQMLGPKMGHYVVVTTAEKDAKLGRNDEARSEFGRAAALARNARERELLQARAQELAPQGHQLPSP